MVRTAEATLRQEERTERRRTQILNAAQNCFRAEGFHAASISRIAAEAEMSAGHIYKYFENKDAIVIALAERDFEEFMSHITQIDRWSEPDIDLIVKRYIEEIPYLLDFSGSALVLEIYAEAARNPKVAEMVARVDRGFRQAIRMVVEPALHRCTARQIDVRVEMLLILTRALPLHGGTHKDGDPNIIAEGLELAIRGILSQP